MLLQTQTPCSVTGQGIVYVKSNRLALYLPTVYTFNVIGLLHDATISALLSD